MKLSLIWKLLAGKEHKVKEFYRVLFYLVKIVEFEAAF